MTLYAPLPHNNLGSLKSFPYILLSPRLRQHNYLFQRFLAELSGYYLAALNGPINTLPSFLREVRDAIEVQGGFAPRLGQILSTQENDPEILADALVSDLSLRPELNWIAIDNFDRFNLDASFAKFLQHLVHIGNENVHLVLHGRILDEDFWQPFIRNEQATILESAGTVSPRERSSTEVRLEINAFAGGTVYLNGLPPMYWDGPLVLNLLYYLIDHAMITRHEIFETFWPMLNAKEATNVFHVTKRKLAQTLGFEITDYQSGFYCHARDFQLIYDVAAFEALIQQSERSEAELKRIIALHRHPYLYGINMPWIQSRRDELYHRYIEVLLELARLYRHQRKMDLALIYYGRAHQHAPEREDIARDLMEVMAANGAKDKAIQVFQTLRDVLQRRFNIQPSSSTVKVYQALLSSS